MIEELKAAVLAVDAEATFDCAVVDTEEDLLDEAVRALGFTHYVDLVWMPRRPYERSKFIAGETAEGYIALPLIYVLAWTVPAFRAQLSESRPYWTDGDHTNQVTSNISFISTSAPNPIGQHRNKYGHRAGTPEYRKAYYADPANRAKNREHQRRSSKKKREVLKRAEEIVQAAAPDRLAELRRKLLGEE